MPDQIYWYAGGSGYPGSPVTVTKGTTVNFTYSMTVTTTTGAFYNGGTWLTNTSANGNYFAPNLYEQPRRQETDEERTERENRIAAERAEAQRRRDERMAVETAAGVRARELLLSLLDEAQRTDYERNRAFDVAGSRGGRYRVHHGVAGNVSGIVRERGRERRYTYCAHPRMTTDGGRIPTEDAMVAQLLMIRHDERRFLETANRSGGTPVGREAA